VNEISTALAGFGVVCCIILASVYLFSLPGMHKTVTGKVTCTVLMLSLAVLQFTHLLHFVHGTELLSKRWYGLLLAITPLSFFFFSRELLFHGDKPSRRDLIHALFPLSIAFIPMPWAAVASFAIGCLYTLYIFVKIIRLRTQIPRFAFERFFFGLFFGMNVLALALGLAAPWLDNNFFFHGYSSSISIALVLITSALLIYPELLTDVLLASETIYAKTKLGNVDVDQSKQQLIDLMTQQRYYENENLTLSDVADQLDISSQQLSELVNSNFGVSFPRYIREHRVEAAKKMLLAEPDSSVLSISMATGFKSQSSFYTAFKELTGETPASFRKPSST